MFRDKVKDFCDEFLYGFVKLHTISEEVIDSSFSDKFYSNRISIIEISLQQGETNGERIILCHLQ